MMVCEAYMLASSIDVITLYSSMERLMTKPMAIGIMKAIMPWVNVRTRFLRKLLMFISRPARNMI